MSWPRDAMLREQHIFLVRVCALALFRLVSPSTKCPKHLPPVRNPLFSLSAVQLAEKIRRRESFHFFNISAAKRGVYSQFPPCSGLQNDYLGSGPKCRYAEDPLGESKNVKFFFTVVDDGGAPLTSPVDNQLIQAQKRLDCIIYLMADEGSVWTVWELIKRIFGRSEHTVAAIGKLTSISLEFFFLHFIIFINGVLLYPSHPLLAHKHHHPHFTPHNFSYTSNNCLSLPVTQCPLGLSKERLLLAVQVVVGKLQDHLPLAVALYLEKAFGGWVNPGVV
uniref:Fatty acid amide hydrolase 2b n=1 Tax=Cyprinus carpio carpio TaxID=630221 RepID=A0A8C1E4M7_CYPCA